ncbi:MAG: ABC transporter permease [Rhodospirillales bacterium]|nr:ABC transporter permease [Rhodospirillales bacterium]MDH3790391.1 ABC transporter permease [Rhodospirillales bacterium]MDH3911919.1 ABC transporter permease [Rhodospirillales bacterium]MDH3920086.1 ABC transporter permease [Rhodospirillales bacterium]MDH3969523.1 ABC transporter permease [Rhodospirillales bacterium]
MAEQTVSAPGADERLLKTPLSRKLLNRPELGAVAGAVLVFFFFGIVAGDSGMFSLKGIVNFLEVSALLGILAIAVSLLMIGGEFDLSVGSMIGAAGVVIAIPAVQFGWPLWLCIVLAFGVAAAVGYANGMITVKTGLPSFIVTLAVLFILRGLTIGATRLITGRTQVSGIRDVARDDWLAAIFGGDAFTGLFAWMAEAGIIEKRMDGLPVVPGVPMSIVWFVILGTLATWLLLRTSFGNWIFACGGDKIAARNVGVPVTRVKVLLFIFTACAATLVATIQVLDAGSADTNRGLLKEFEAIIAAVIGGCLLTGGYGSAIGAMFGAIIFGTVQMGIFYTGVNTDWFKVFLGVMLLIAVLFNSYIRKKVTEAR